MLVSSIAVLNSNAHTITKQTGMDKVKQLLEILAAQSVSSIDLRSYAMSLPAHSRPAGVYKSAVPAEIEKIYPVRVLCAVT